MSNKKTIDFFESDLIKNKTRNFLIFGGEKSGKSKIVSELLKLSKNPVINIFANDKNYKTYQDHNVKCNHLTFLKLKKVKTYYIVCVKSLTFSNLATMVV